MKSEELTKLGFTKNESKVYFALLESGLSTITTLVNKLHFHKQVIYDNLHRLISKGMVSFVVKSNRKHFNAVSPEKIKEIFSEQEKELEDKKEILENLLPELSSIRSKAEEKQIAMIYQDKKGIFSIFNEIFNERVREVLSFGNEGKFNELFPAQWKEYNKKREKIKQKWKIIWNEKLRGKREQIKFSEIKYLPKEFENPASTIIYENKVAIILWEEIPFAIKIESSKITKSYKNTFENLWKIAKK